MKVREGKTDRERNREKLSSVVPFVKCLQQQGLGQVQAGSQGHHPGLPHR